jgi:hypothetical protein
MFTTRSLKVKRPMLVAAMLLSIHYPGQVHRHCLCQSDISRIVRVRSQVL